MTSQHSHPPKSGDEGGAGLPLPGAEIALEDYEIVALYLDAISELSSLVASGKQDAEKLQYLADKVSVLKRVRGVVPGRPPIPPAAAAGLRGMHLGGGGGGEGGAACEGAGTRPLAAESLPSGKPTASLHRTNPMRSVWRWRWASGS